MKRSPIRKAGTDFPAASATGTTGRARKQDRAVSPAGGGHLQNHSGQDPAIELGRTSVRIVFANALPPMFQHASRTTSARRPALRACGDDHGQGHHGDRAGTRQRDRPR